MGKAFPVTKVEERRAIAIFLPSLVVLDHPIREDLKRGEEVNENMGIILTTDINNNESLAV